jgi:hypothetical protein
MKESEEKDTVNQLFSHFNGQWDTNEPELGHHGRFLSRLEGKPVHNKESSKLFRIAMPVAAAIAMVLGLVFTFNSGRADAMAHNRMSPQAKEAQLYFSSVIAKELVNVEKEKSPETQKLVKDALVRMRALEEDYNRLLKELQEKGENKKIIHAMITNLQTRISFLEEVQQKIDTIKTIKENYHENNNA